MTKEGYQPIKKETIKIIPPNTGSHVYMKKDSYTWEDMDRSYWEGFDTAKGKIEKRIAELEKENAELRTVKIPQLERKIASIRGAHSVDCKKLNARTEQVERLKKENAELKTKATALEKANKANEWHYVKDGKLPTHSNRVLVFTDEDVGFGIYGLDDKKWHTYDTGFDVIAWKEIVIPEEEQ